MKSKDDPRRRETELGDSSEGNIPPSTGEAVGELDIAAAALEMIVGDDVREKLPGHTTYEEYAGRATEGYERVIKIAKEALVAMGRIPS